MNNYDLYVQLKAIERQAKSTFEWEQRLTVPGDSVEAQIGTAVLELITNIEETAMRAQVKSLLK